MKPLFILRIIPPMDKNFFVTVMNSPIGKLILASDKISLVGAWFEGQKYIDKKILNNAILKDNLDVFDDTKLWLKDYFRGIKVQANDLPIAPIGSEFRQLVWRELCKIPYGELSTYGKIAKEIARQKSISKMSAQAVGSAVGHNPIAIIIPCHRVVASNGNLTGYAGGLEKKIKLLELEVCNK